MGSKETKKILANSLISLLEEKPIEKITIQEIVDGSGFNRQTFYYHFTDIYDLLEWILQRNYGLLSENHVFETEDSLMVKIEKAFSYLSEKRTLILHSYNPNHRYYYEGFMRPWISAQLEKMIQSSPLSAEISLAERRFIKDSFTWAFLGLFFRWLEKGMPNRSQDIIENYYLLIEASMEASLKAFAEKNRKNS